MPEMDGFEVAERIRAEPSASPTTIMLLSSADRPGDAERSRELGITRFLRKPVKYSELMDAIQMALHESGTVVGIQSKRCRPVCGRYRHPSISW